MRTSTAGKPGAAWFVSILSLLVLLVPNAAFSADAIADKLRELAAEEAQREATVEPTQTPERAALERQRESEAAQLAAKLAQVRARYAEQTEHPVTPGDDQDAQPAPTPSVSATLAPPAQVPEAPPTHVTVLLVMAPGHKGIRRFDTTADPVLCLSDRCYVSRGAQAEARLRTLGETLGAGNTLGKRAEACNHKLACVYRNVDLKGLGAQVQPVDLHILEHDRREQRPIQADMSCTLSDGHLRCQAPVDAGSYRLWVVPETLATQAGPAVLLDATEAGLPDAMGLAASFSVAHR